MRSLIHGAAHGATTRGHTLGSPRRYDLIAEVAFVGRRRATFQALVAAAGVHPGQRVLDVGCGTGWFARLLAQAVGPAGLVIGLDPSPAMVAYARRQAGGAQTCWFEVGAAEALAFPDGHFDVVTCSLVLHHLPSDLRPQALAEMRRVLVPGGTLLVAEAHAPSHGLGWRLLARLHGFDRMARQVPNVPALVAQAAFSQIRSGETPPWLRYVVASKPANAA